MTESSSFTLKQLPLPAKLVLTVFLLTVGLGYTSAMVQLHMQHSARDGEALPKPEQVVAIFAGKVWQPANGPALKPAGKLERLIMGPISGAPWNGSGSMAPAFFERDGGEYKRTVKEATPDEKTKLDDERNGERLALQAWIRADPDARKKAHDEDKFAAPEGTFKAITADFLHADKTVRVTSILRDRCARCHAKGSGDDAEKFPLETYDQLAKYLDAPAGSVLPPDGGWVDSGKQVSLEKLTQSTHAHLLSFAMLFSLTGLIFAFTSYPVIVRCVLAPMVLIAQVADISCWWLARLDGPGPYFALAIMGTGAVVGMGLMAQIFLSLFSMYGAKGRVVLLLLLVTGAGAGGVLYKTKIAPYLADEKAAQEKAKK